MNLLPSSPRIIIRATLEPAIGTRFQPTGFPDVGAATYQLADGTRMLLVESEQSIANRLESVCWDTAAKALQPTLEGMPYVQVMDEDGTALTSSLLEAHRLNSVYIKKSPFFSDLEKEIGYDKKKPVDLGKLAQALCKFDPNSLIHGIFLEKVAGTLRLPRALSGFIEARNVQIVSAGGVKNDRVTAETEKGSDRTAKEGYGNVPFHRDEYTAERIDAFFKLDVALIRSFGLGDQVSEFLVALSLWKVQAFLEEGLRLRTSCDFDATEVSVTRPKDWALPSRAELAARLQALIGTLSTSGTFGPSPTTTTYTGK